MSMLRSVKRKISETAQKLIKRRRIETVKPKDTANINDIAIPPEQDIIFATQTRNYFLGDPLQDWFKYHYTSLAVQKPQYTKEILQSVSSRSVNDFTSFIMSQGVDFESHVIRLLHERFGSTNVISIGGELNPRSKEKLQETLDEMNKGTPIIHSGLLHNPQNNTGGIPDLIIRSDWLNKVVKIFPFSKHTMEIPAPNLRDKEDQSKTPNYHYRIVDIKFSTLYLRSDGLHILNCSSFKAYKGQLLIYNQALGLLQGYEPPEAYILGRKWKFNSCGDPFSGDSCFDRFGIIDYKGVDAEYVELLPKALKWVADVKSDEAKNWNISKPPLTRPELYPNMCQNSDSPWRGLKKKIAKEYNELTMLWMVGKKHRENAHKLGIYSWTDKRCTVDTLGIKGKYTKNILDKILEINQPSRRKMDLKIKPLTIRNNFYDWQTPDEVEFYVDFETINNVFTDHSSLPHVVETSFIFMIGVGYVNPETEQWIYKSFVVDTLTAEEERKICYDFSRYILKISKNYNIENPKCYHWAHAEQTMWNDAEDRHFLDVRNKYKSQNWNTEKWQWCDLLKVFKDEPIVLQGCLGFSLKDVAKTMKKHGMIQVDWDSSSSCLDGQGAMVGAWNAYKESKIRNTSMKNIPQIKEIEKYNEVDVKVMKEILYYLRENHSELYQNIYLE